MATLNFGPDKNQESLKPSEQVIQNIPSAEEEFKKASGRLESMPENIARLSSDVKKEGYEDRYVELGQETKSAMQIGSKEIDPDSFISEMESLA